MFKKLLVSAILGLGIASAASYNVTLTHPSSVKGTQLKAGDYRINVENDKVVFMKGKESVEAPVKIQNADKKYSVTAVRYAADNSILEIQVGGTKTALVFAN